MSQYEQETATVRNGTDAAHALRALETAYIGPRRDEIIKQAMTALKDGNLTPELAVQLWTQLYEHKRVVKNLTDLQKRGVQASARISSGDVIPV